MRLRLAALAQLFQEAFPRERLSELDTAGQVLCRHDHLRQAAPEYAFKDFDAFTVQNSLRQHLLPLLPEVRRDFGMDSQPDLLPDVPVDDDCVSAGLRAARLGQRIEKGIRPAVVGLAKLPEDGSDGRVNDEEVELSVLE